MARKRPKSSKKKRPGKHSKKHHRYLKQPRRAFHSFESEQGQVQVLRYRGKRRLFKPVGSRDEAKKRELEQRIVHTLFPKNVPRPISITEQKEMPSLEQAKQYGAHTYDAMKESAPRKHGVVMEIVPRDKNHKQFQKLWYDTNRELKRTELPFGFSGKDVLDEVEVTARARHKLAEHRAHLDFYRKKGLPLFRRMKKWGITMSDSPVNYVDRGGTPVILDHPVNINPTAMKSRTHELPAIKRPLFRKWLRELEELSKKLNKERKKRLRETTK